MITKIENAQIFNTEKRCFAYGSLCFKDNHITDTSLVPDLTIDAHGGYILPGLIDVHTHGRSGIDIIDADEKELSALALPLPPAADTSHTFGRSVPSTKGIPLRYGGCSSNRQVYHRR